jgi:CO dehydrogenase maturation factor
LIKKAFAEHLLLGFIPEFEEIVTADREGRRPFEDINEAPQLLFDIADKLSLK